MLASPFINPVKLLHKLLTLSVNLCCGQHALRQTWDLTERVKTGSDRIAANKHLMKPKSFEASHTHTLGSTKERKDKLESEEEAEC